MNKIGYFLIFFFNINNSFFIIINSFLNIKKSLVILRKPSPKINLNYIEFGY